MPGSQNGIRQKTEFSILGRTGGISGSGSSANMIWTPKTQCLCWDVPTCTNVRQFMSYQVQ